VTDYVSSHCSPSPNSCGIIVPGCPALPLTQSIQGDVTVTDVSVFCAEKSILVSQVTDYVSSHCSHPPIHLGTSVPGCLALPLTQSIQGVNVTVPDVSVSMPRVNFGESGD